MSDVTNIFSKKRNMLAVGKQNEHAFRVTATRVPAPKVRSDADSCHSSRWSLARCFGQSAMPHPVLLKADGERGQSNCGLFANFQSWRVRMKSHRSVLGDQGASADSKLERGQEMPTSTLIPRRENKRVQGWNTSIAVGTATQRIKTPSIENHVVTVIPGNCAQ